VVLTGSIRCNLLLATAALLADSAGVGRGVGDHRAGSVRIETVDTARHARMRRSPKLQCESGRLALGSSRPALRTPASAGIPRNLQLDETGVTGVGVEQSISRSSGLTATANSWARFSA
jgi:hypothetical protein